MLKLKPPTPTDKPKTRAENCAAGAKVSSSANANTTKLPNLQQRTMDGGVAETEGTNKNQDSNGAIGPSKFVEFCKSDNASNAHISAESLEGFNYLNRGAPFHGQSWFADKATVQAAGARWTPNTFVGDENNHGARDGLKRVKGWWSAPDEEKLIHLIKLRDIDRIVWAPLGLNMHAAKYICNMWAAYQRTVLREEVLDTQLRVAIAQVEAEAQAQREAEAREQLEAQEAAKREARLSSVPECELCAQDIPTDDPEDVNRLVNELQVPWTEEYAAASSRSAGLGPHSGVTRARRALRALHLKIVTIDAARRGDWEVPQLPPLLELPEIRQRDFFYDLEKKMKFLKKDSTGVHSLKTTGFSIPSSRPRVSSPLVRAKSMALTANTHKEDDCSVRQFTSEATTSLNDEVCAEDQVSDPEEVECVEYPPFRNSRITWCTTCGARIDLQFADCKCGERRWTECKNCMCACCDEQQCACSVGAHGWWARQHLVEQRLSFIAPPAHHRARGVRNVPV